MDNNATEELRTAVFVQIKLTRNLGILNVCMRIENSSLYEM